MKIKVPLGIDRRHIATILLDDLVLASMTLSQLDDLSQNTGAIDLAVQPLRARMLAASRLLIQQEGEGFFYRSLNIHIEVRDLTNELEAVDTYGPYSSQEVLSALDVAIDATTSLVDGSYRRPRRDPGEAYVIAFYLPQFYPFAENDKWWGEGFTEWSNVVEARPNLPGHRMPLLPADLGFYDLRMADTRRRQGKLAEDYGIDGFCYYFYWFNGRRIMRDVLDAILASGVPDNDFCLCWANESWSRRWDGSEDAVDLLLKQDHDPATDATLINDLIPYFLDQRYIKIDGSPLLLVYRLDIMHDAASVFSAWREEARRNRLPGLFIAAVRSFGLEDADAIDVDAIVDFPPHTAASTELQNTMPTHAGFEGKIYDYRQVVINAAARVPGAKLSFPGVMPRWDNTPRKGERSHLFWNSSPSAFKLWLAIALEQARQRPPGKRFLFINSWNEWGEGAMLEPDRVFGRAYLEAVRSSRGGYVVSPSDAAQFALISSLPATGADAFLQGFAAEVQMVAKIISWQHARGHETFRPGAPELVTLAHDQTVRAEGVVIVDYCSSPRHNDTIVLSDGQPLHIRGWAMTKRGAPRSYDALAYICLMQRGRRDIEFHMPVVQWIQRVDIVNYHGLPHDPGDSYFGFELIVDTDSISNGTYDCSMLEAVDGCLYQASCDLKIERQRR